MRPLIFRVKVTSEAGAMPFIIRRKWVACRPALRVMLAGRNQSINATFDFTKAQHFHFPHEKVLPRLLYADADSGTRSKQCSAATDITQSSHDRLFIMTMSIDIISARE